MKTKLFNITYNIKVNKRERQVTAGPFDKSGAATLAASLSLLGIKFNITQVHHAKPTQAEPTETQG